MSHLTDDIRTLRGVGEKKAQLFHKLGLFTLGDCLEHFPREYEDRSRFYPIAQAPVGENCCILATVAQPPSTRLIRKGLSITKLRAFDESGQIDLVYFNQPYLSSQLRQGEEYAFFGKIEGTLLKKHLTNPQFEAAGRGMITGRLLPVYRLTGGLSRTLMLQATSQAIQYTDELTESLDEEIRQQYDLCHIRYAYENIHYPVHREALEEARKRVIFEEFFQFACGLQLMGQQNITAQGIGLTWYPPEDFYQVLPFSPTGAQRRAVHEAFSDMTGGKRMSRLVQGDVGSGKTMVAAACLWLAAKNGMQGALMAPTELLARQHYESLQPLMEQCGISCALLTGSTPKKQRETMLEKLSQGEISVLIGTHALIENNVVFCRPALTITDEQHRFGVRQRQLLWDKGADTHSLVMSATPIPRTLALMLYGDLQVSVLDELPPGRKRVETYAVPPSYRPRLDAFIQKQVQEGGQVYIVCPLIETEEGEDERQSAVAYAKALEQRVPQVSIGLMHGKLKSREKEQVMEDFVQGKIQVLVSTTVIEVGVNVPRASLMIVEDADRFGLSQLHQLRGRVGRGDRQSYCVLVSASKSAKTQERLRVMTKCHDGFRIAEADLKLRGPGDFFGDRQHGLPEFRIADLSQDVSLLQNAQQAAQQVLRQDPDLSSHPLLLEKVKQLFHRAQQ